MSVRNRTNLTGPDASSDPQTPRWASRASRRLRYERRDLRDALNEARTLVHFDRAAGA